VLGWFRKTKAPAGVQQESAFPEDEQRAYDRGREIARMIADGVEDYASRRQKDIRGDFLDLLQQRIDKARQQDDYAPITVARVEYQCFMKEVDKAQEKLIEETASGTRNHWGEKLLDDLGVDDERLTKLAKKFIDDWALALKLEGLKLLQDNVDILKRADDRWRAKFPEKAALELPVDE
jgi:hypothetical protein